MDWLPLRDWAFVEIQGLSDEGFWEGAEWPGPQWPGDRRDWLKERDAAVRAAIEHWLLNGEWGELARDERAALHYRLCWASQFLSVLTMLDEQDRQIVPPSHEDRETVLRWVLLDTWDVVGRETVRRRLIRRSKLP